MRTVGTPTVRKASAFGTWSLTVQGVDVDLATARRETYERPGALPTVIPGTVEDDLARRDFSINAMAISLGEDSWGYLLDPHGGSTDLERGVIRVLHDRSFEDDATRIFRAIRYACRLDFRLESCTATLLERSLPYVSTISPDRVRHEIERIFREPRASDMIEMVGTPRRSERPSILQLRADPVQRFRSHRDLITRTTTQVRAELATSRRWYSRSRTATTWSRSLNDLI